jgi:hypothetical protein
VLIPNLPLHRRIPLETESGEIFSLISSRVFSFSRQQASESDQGYDTPQWDAGLQPAHISPASMSNESAATAVPSSPTPVPFSAVSSSSYVSAVKDLLSAAGLPLDLDREKLMEEAATLRETHRVQTQALGEVRGRSTCL